MKNFSLLIGAIAFLVMGTGVATAQGNGNENGQGATVESTYLDDINFSNPCCGGVINLSGTVHVVFNEKNGKVHVNYSGLGGVDEDGNVYHGTAVGNSTQEFNEEDGSYTFCFNQIIRLASSSGCSVTIKLRGCFGWNPEDGYWEDIQVNEVRCDDDLS